MINIGSRLWKKKRAPRENVKSFKEMCIQTDYVIVSKNNTSLTDVIYIIVLKIKMKRWNI